MSAKVVGKGEIGPITDNDYKVLKLKNPEHIRQNMFRDGKRVFMKNYKTGEIKQCFFGAKEMKEGQRKGGRSRSEKKRKALTLARQREITNPKTIIKNLDKVEFLMKNPKNSVQFLYDQMLAMLESPNLQNSEQARILRLMQDNHKLWHGEKKALEISGEVKHTHSIQDVMKKIQGIDDVIEVDSKEVEKSE